MMSEIYQRGPVVCSVATPEDFTYGYRGGIYKDPLNYTRDTVDHNVEVRTSSLLHLVRGASNLIYLRACSSLLQAALLMSWA